MERFIAVPVSPSLMAHQLQLLQSQSQNTNLETISPSRTCTALVSAQVECLVSERAEKCLENVLYTDSRQPGPATTNLRKTVPYRSQCGHEQPILRQDLPCRATIEILYRYLSIVLFITHRNIIVSAQQDFIILSFLVGFEVSL